MTDVMSAWTGRFAPDYLIPPGQTLSELLEEHGMTQTDLARRLGVSLKHVNQIVNGTASISAELALGLEKVLGVSAAFWLNRESLYRADKARHDEEESLVKAIAWARKFPTTEMKRRNLLPREADGTVLVESLLRFFGIASPRQWADPTIAYRKSLRFASDPYALAVWLREGELRATALDCKPYDADQFTAALQSVRRLTRLEPSQWYPDLVRICAEVGVAVVIVDTFAGSRANGASRWLTPTRALIQLSLRYRWEDVFWFTFFHEAGHVLLHRKRAIFVEGLGPSENASADVQEAEREADQFASRTLIPPRFDNHLRELSTSQISSFAEVIGIAPAIVVGRLQHDQLLPFNQGNDLRRRLAFAKTTK